MAKRAQERYRLPDPAEQPLLTVEDLVQLGLGGVRWWYQRIHSGDVPSVRYGRRIYVPNAALRRAWGFDESA